MKGKEKQKGEPGEKSATDIHKSKTKSRP